MKNGLFIFLTLLLCCPSQQSDADIVTDSFSGTAALVSPGNIGDHTGATYTFSVLDTNDCATLSYDINVEVLSDADGNGAGPLHFDTRGFGDSGGNNDALQGGQGIGGEILEFSITNISVTALPGFTYISDNVRVQISSFDLVNNGNNSPSVIWDDDIGAPTTYASSGTSSGHTETVGTNPGAQVLSVNAANAWMWINNVQTQFRGEVRVSKAVPEPGSAALLLFCAGSLALSSRRRSNYN